MATPKWWRIVLVDNSTIFVPICGEKCVTGVIFSDLPKVMKTGFLSHVKNWYDWIAICEYFESLNPLNRWHELNSIYTFFCNSSDH
jgi:hypothetical protein